MKMTDTQNLGWGKKMYVIKDESMCKVIYVKF